MKALVYSVHTSAACSHYDCIPSAFASSDDPACAAESSGNHGRCSVLRLRSHELNQNLRAEEFNFLNRTLRISGEILFCLSSLRRVAIIPHGRSIA